MLLNEIKNCLQSFLDYWDITVYPEKNLITVKKSSKAYPNDPYPYLSSFTIHTLKEKIYDKYNVDLKIIANRSGFAISVVKNVKLFIPEQTFELDVEDVEKFTENISKMLELIHIEKAYQTAIDHAKALESVSEDKLLLFRTPEEVFSKELMERLNLTRERAETVATILQKLKHLGYRYTLVANPPTGLFRVPTFSILIHSRTIMLSDAIFLDIPLMYHYNPRDYKWILCI